MTPTASGYGITIPFDGISLADHKDLLEMVADLGYDGLWTSEVAGLDAFAPLALAAAETTLRVGTAIVPVFTRGPALLASSAAALAELAPGRFALGVGSSSPAIVQTWNGIAFDDPLARVRDVVRFLRTALSGQKVQEHFPSFSSQGFRLERPPQIVPPILVAALRPGMLHLAAAEGDGVILNWLGHRDVPKVLEEFRNGLADREERKEVVARLFVCPTEDVETAGKIGRRLIAGYLTVPAYARYQRWLGRGEQLAGLWDAWSRGDRPGALRAISDQVLDELVIHGSLEQCRSHIARFTDAGVNTVVLQLLLPDDVKLTDALAGLAPRR